MAEMLKYFSRILLISVPANNAKKQVGAARLLEEAAMKASSALPAVLKELRSIKIEQVSSQVDTLKEVMNEDIRILEGIALQLVVTKKILRLCQRENLYEDVQTYLTEVLIPSYEKLMTSHNDATPPKPVPEARPISKLVQIDEINAATAVLVKGGKFLAIAPGILKTRTTGMLQNCPTKVQEGVKKMVQVPRERFEENEWTSITQKINGRLHSPRDEVPMYVTCLEAPSVGDATSTESMAPCVEDAASTVVEASSVETNAVALPASNNVVVSEGTKKNCSIVLPEAQKTEVCEVESPLDKWVECEKCETWFHAKSKKVYPKMFQKNKERTYSMDMLLKFYCSCQLYFIILKVQISTDGRNFHLV